MISSSSFLVFLVPPVFPAGSSHSCTRGGLCVVLCSYFTFSTFARTVSLFPCVLPSAPRLLPSGEGRDCPHPSRWRVRTPLLGQRLSWVLASSGTLLGKQRWRAGPGYLILATLYWDLEICLCCQEIYNCNRPNISRKQTKSCWFCLYCYLFTDWKCQEWSLTVRNSMPVLQMFGSGIILCI